ncbi:hypothetical protein HK405_012966 [Cladochytrium tenue]|nr:hypothetical protein HK405_012966 [Cladochytrium tenue]
MTGDERAATRTVLDLRVRNDHLTSLLAETHATVEQQAREIAVLRRALVEAEAQKQLTAVGQLHGQRTVNPRVASLYSLCLLLTLSQLHGVPANEDDDSGHPSGLKLLEMLAARDATIDSLTLALQRLDNELVDARREVAKHADDAESLRSELHRLRHHRDHHNSSPTRPSGPPSPRRVYASSSKEFVVIDNTEFAHAGAGDFQWADPAPRPNPDPRDVIIMKLESERDRLEEELLVAYGLINKCNYAR